MSRIVSFTLCSLDWAVDNPGRYFPNPSADGPSPPGYDQDMEALERRLISAQMAVLLGRRMYDEWSQYWPTSSEQPFADFINNTPKYVLSSSDLGPSAWSSSCKRLTGPLETVVQTLKEDLHGTGDIGVHGSITLVQSLLAAGLIDEVQLAVAPVLDPLGRRLFDDVRERLRWELVDCVATENGAVWLTYRP